MNKAIVYLYLRSLQNSFKLLLKKPLKLLGTIFSIAYFAALPFFMRGMIEDFGLDTPSGFVMIASMFVLYISLPATLTYFRRKGIMFRSSDINFIFASPVNPKWSLLYGLIKNAYLTLLLQLVIPLTAVLIFHVPVETAVLYGLAEMILANVSGYSMALIMYGSERISENQKKLIPKIVYGLMGLISVWLLYSIYRQGFSIAAFTAILSSPVFLLIPYFGWQVGFLNLLILSVNPYTLISGILYILITIVLFITARRMKCHGEYYEDALTFADNYEEVLLRNTRDRSMIFRLKNKKINKVKTSLSGNGAYLIFSRQLLSYRRQHRYLVRFTDLIHLAIGLFILFVTFDEGTVLTPLVFFYIVMGIAIYLGTFFSALNQWQAEFDQYSLYLIPDSNLHKLFYATLMEHVTNLFRALLVILPLAFSFQINVIYLVLGIVLFTLMKSVIVYIGILFKDIIGNQVGASFAAILNMFVNLVILLVPLGLGILIAVFNYPIWLAFAAAIAYCLLVDFLALTISSKTLVHIEALTN